MISGTPRVDARDRRRPVRLELSPKIMVSLVLVGATLWLLIKLWPVLLVLVVALPIAATAMMLIEELRVELPGEQEQSEDRQVRKADDRAEAEYERRTAGVGAERAAAIAVEISADRRKDERHEPSDKEGGNRQLP